MERKNFFPGQRRPPPSAAAGSSAKEAASGAETQGSPNSVRLGDVGGDIGEMPTPLEPGGDSDEDLRREYGIVGGGQQSTLKFSKGTRDNTEGFRLRPGDKNDSEGKSRRKISFLCLFSI